MTDSRGRKTLVFEHWYAIDYALLGGRCKDRLREEKLDDYVSAKGSLLSNLYEIYKKLDYDPEIQYKNVNEMVFHSKKLAEISTKRAEDIITKESVTKMIREEMADFQEKENLTSEHVADYIIGRRFKAIVLDAMMLESVLSTHGNKTALTDFQGNTLVDAHKILRDTLVEIVM